MKKSILSLAIVAFASAVNAAACSWSATVITPDPVGTAATSYHAYLCDASVYSATVLAADLANGDFSKLSTDGFVQKTVTTAAQGTTGNARIASVTFGDYAAGSEFTFYTLILNGEGTAATYFTISADKTGTAPSSGYLAMGFMNLSAGAQTAWTQTGAIPEPTSGLLLLLGMAGLALRRRRA